MDDTSLTAPCLLLSRDILHTFKFGPALLFLPCDVNPLKDGGFPILYLMPEESMEEGRRGLPVGESRGAFSTSAAVSKTQSLG
jgi:hypothetical protein